MSCAVNAPELTGFVPGNYILTLDFDVKNTTDGLDILKNISGSAPTGAVLAVMGPSCARKSTLVDILAGKNKGGKVTGQTVLNGKQIHLSEILHAVGYVDQEDTMPPAQTVPPQVWTRTVPTWLPSNCAILRRVKHHCDFDHSPTSIRHFYMFDQTLEVSEGDVLYLRCNNTDAEYFNRRELDCTASYNIADYMLDIAMDRDLVALVKNYVDADDTSPTFLITRQCIVKAAWSTTP
ncbi:hypothetical protein BG000_007409 [Podila horticola]|nr:hypothetical protein BG000_007409 [Podila horticola]